jgi:hypothetical protein
MKRFVLFGVLVVLIGCAATSTERLESEEAKTSSGIEVQKILHGQTGYSRSEAKVSSNIEVQKPPRMSKKEELKLVESVPVPKTSRRPWGGMFNVPAGLKPPKSETTTENITAPQESPSSLTKKIEEEAPTHVESAPSPKLADRVKTSSSPKSKRKPWGGMWGSYMPPKSQMDSAGTSTQPPPASWEDYKEVSFGKFASGSYVSDYANKYLRFKCRFSGIGSEFVEFLKYPQPDYVTFIVSGVESKLYSLCVVMSRQQADPVFKLKLQKEVVLYGKAVQVDLHTLTMEVLKIER